jgi:type VI secretion system protein ImpI
MILTLSIENESRLPDGGPLSVRLAGGRGIDIGRQQGLDWTLPDPSKAISSRHCEVRFRDGAYWLHDVSTNGTFLNGGSGRMQSPYRLKHGDRIEIGHYIIIAAFEGPAAAQVTQPGDYTPPPAAPLDTADIWGGAGDGLAPPPVNRRDLMAPSANRPVQPDFLDWAVDTGAPMPSNPESVSRADRGSAAAWPPQADAWSAPSRAERSIPREADEQPAAWVQPVVPTPRRPGASQAPQRSIPPEGEVNPWDVVEEPANLPPMLAVEAAPPAVRTPPPVADPTPWSAPLPDPPAGRERQTPMPVPSGGSLGSQDVVRRFAEAAGIPVETMAIQDPAELAELLGRLMRIVAQDMKQLLSARAESKRIARSTNQTMIQALNNNPLKFSPTAEDALKLMFGRPTSGYLDARRSLEEGFKDLKIHQVKTYSAMQHALRLLVEDLDPHAIAESVDSDKGLGALIGSRKAKLWDTYTARWDAKTAPHEDGLVDAFMIYFSECYDQGGGKGGKS